MHPWIVSVATHAGLAAALWTGAGRIGPRGPGESPASDGVREEAVDVTWELADLRPPDETPVFDAPERDAPPPRESIDAPAIDEPPMAMDPLPAELDLPPDDPPPSAEPAMPEPELPFAPGRPIPRAHPVREVPATPTAAAPPLAAALPSPAAPAAPPSAPPRPFVAIRTAGGGSGLRPPTLDPSSRAPIRPADALARGEHGRVRLLIHVSAEGLVTDVTIAQSSGSPSLDGAALDAARTWRFRPATREDGTAIASNVRMGVTFD